MRYRIQIEGLLGSTLIVVTKFEEYGGTIHGTTRMYTASSDDVHTDRLEEVISWLAMTLAESVS